MNAEPLTFMFTDFIKRKKEKVICFKRGDCENDGISLSSRESWQICLLAPHIRYGNIQDVTLFVKYIYRVIISVVHTLVSNI